MGDTARMKTLASITQGHSDYDDRLRTLLDGLGIDPHEFIGLDYFGVVPFFVLAGATVRPDAHSHGLDVHVSTVEVELSEELEDAFFATLAELLEDAYSDD